MNTWILWNQYNIAIDNLPKIELQKETPPSLDRETHLFEQNKERVSRFLYCIQQMPRAWGSRPWSSHEIQRAGNNIANDLFRRKVRREYLGKG